VISLYTGYNDFLSVIDANYFYNNLDYLNTGVYAPPIDLTSGIYALNISGDNSLLINTNTITNNFLAASDNGDTLTLNLPSGNLYGFGAEFCFLNDGSYISGELVFNINDTQSFTGIVPENYLGDEDFALLEDENGENLGDVIPVFFGFAGEPINKITIYNSYNQICLDNYTLGTISHGSNLYIKIKFNKKGVKITPLY
jgi:hypothetical protein